MPVSARNSSPSAPEAAVLLVLLPLAGRAEPARALTLAGLAQLQHRLGGGIRVLKIEESLHPDVVRSFHAEQLPACVLVRQGKELWRQTGLPDSEATIALLTRLIAEPGAAREVA
ncbi:thioredoxin [Hymenobacter gummosus]|uniref:Thioredoxin n=1 Tax=Hymenobacter gummosus TaxID=1776032 RepID=A0A431U8Z9_9BACT|nr:thioredoxin [Hymenobacter gummosus]RTQ53306.1 thioredoxin [Hymenobacter gummosus]